MAERVTVDSMKLEPVKPAIRLAKARIGSGAVSNTGEDFGIFAGIDENGRAVMPLSLDQGDTVSPTLIRIAMASALHSEDQGMIEALGQLVDRLPPHVRLQREIEPVSVDQLASQWIQLLPTGHVVAKDGREFTVTEDGLAQIVERWQALADDVPVDFDHGIFRPTHEGSGRAAGWIEELEVRESGLWARVRWTERAATAIEAREYRYISPVIELDADGVAVELINAALVNLPAIDGMKAVAASLDADVEIPDMEENTFSAEVEDVEAIEADVVDEVEEIEETEAEEVDPDPVATADEDVEPEPVAVDQVDEPELQMHDIVSELATVKALNEQLASELADARLEIARRDAGDRVEKEIAAGRVAPELRDWAMAYAMKDLEGFDQFCSAAPTGRYAPPAGQIFSENTAAATEESAEDLPGDPERLDLHRQVSRLAKREGISFGDAFERFTAE